MSCCGCCERGGCCRQAPQKLVHTAGEDGRIVRVNLLYEPSGCYSNSGNGLADEPPDELFINGFRRDSFDDWIGRLEAMRSLRSTCCFDCWCISCLICLPCFIPCFCSKGKKSIEAWDASFRAWQDGFNTQILGNCGMFVKTQSKCDVIFVPDGKGGVRKQRYIERWLAFALTPEEVAKLKSEPHMVGDIENCSCCGGVNESDLCMHP